MPADIDHGVFLAFDTALGGCTVALLKKGRLISRQVETRRDQAVILIPMMLECLSEGGGAFADIDGLACTIGPGSFTGLRIGLSTARALSLALSKPLAGPTTLDVMARALWPGSGAALILLETGRSDYYAQIICPFAGALTPASALSFEGLGTIINAHAPNALTGDAVPRFLQDGGNSNGAMSVFPAMLPDPRALAMAGAEILTGAGAGGAISRPEPLYLRPADTSLPKPRFLKNGQ